jgi:hypothetical protein
MLRTMLRLDLRSRAPLGGGRKSRRGNGLVLALGFYLLIGTITGFASDIAGVSAAVRLTLLLTVVAIYLFLSILSEYQQILLAPEDGDVLYWRPIHSRTLFVARSLHIFLYVNLLSAALLCTPSLMVALEAPGNLVATWVAFVIAGAGNAALATGVTVLLYSVLLRHVPTARLQDALTWFQVLTSVLIFMGYQALSPLLERIVASSSGTRLVHFLPTRWFAALPEMVGRGMSVEALMALGLGVVGTGVILFVAVQHLAPQYQTALAANAAAMANRAVSHRTHSHNVWRTAATRRWRAFPESLGRGVMRSSAGKAGFDFFVAMFRGDARLKNMLLPMAALPFGILVFGVFQGSLVDPYATGVESVASGDQWGAGKETRLVFLAAYSLVVVALTLSRSLSISASWKAGWVFYASPLADFARFYRGFIWGAFATLIVPTTLILVGLLLFVWRNPLQVLVHLSLPCGLLCMSLSLALWSRPEPPFAREAMRHDHLGQWFHGLLPMVVMFFHRRVRPTCRRAGTVHPWPNSPGKHRDHRRV